MKTSDFMNSNNISRNRRSARNIAAFLLAAALPLGALAETVDGVVIDQYGNPVPGASLQVSGTDISAQTDLSGRFTLDLNADKKLQVSCLGYLTQDFNVGSLRREKDLDPVKIILTEQNVPIERTIPTAYGETSEYDYLGSASTIYNAEINKTMGATVIPSMIGRMAGLNILQYRGWHLTNTTASFHGDIIGNIADNMGAGIVSDNTEFTMSSRGMAPLIYVDGIQRDFLALDEESIESISIQKDALSTMFSGMQSSRPVLLITTKNPKSRGFQVSFTARWGWSKNVNTPKPLNTADYAYLLNEALMNDGREPLYSREDYLHFLNGTGGVGYNNVDWYNTVLRDHSNEQSYNINVSGGNDFVQYFVNAGYYYDKGMFLDANDDYDTSLKSKRYIVNSKVNINVTRDFSATFSLIGRLQEGSQPGGTGSGYSDMLLNVYRTPNNAYPIFNENGSYGGNISWNNNLYAQATNSGYITDNTRDLLAMANLKYNFDRNVKGLSVYLMGSVDVQGRSATFRTMQNPVFEYRQNENGDYVYYRYGNTSTMSNSYRSVSNYQAYWGKIGADYERQWGQHHFKASLSGETRHVLINYDLPMIPSSVFEGFKYDYGKKYFAQLSMSESYYNRYASNKRWGFFWAGGLGWDLAQEAFMSGTRSWLDQFKLRYVHGETGNGISNTGYYNYYQSFNDDGTGFYPQGTAFGSNYRYTKESAMANAYLTWEKAHKNDFGIDAAFFNERLRLSADYYRDSYYDILQTRGKSIEIIGQDWPTENIGKQLREGGEITLSWQDNIGDFNYFLSGNWNIESSKIKFMDEQNQPYDYMVQTGHQTTAIMGLVADGFFTSQEEIDRAPKMTGYNDQIKPGDIRYKDLNDDGVIDNFDRTVIGGDKPIKYYGFSYGANYKGFEFSMDWQGVYDRDIYVNDWNLLQGFMTQGQSYTQGYEILKGRWTPENAANAILPRLSAGGNVYNQGGMYNSSFWVKNGNFLRLRNLYVAYTLPQTFCRNFLGGLRPKIFVNAQNLATIKGCDWNDPEVSFTSYPLQRTWTVGVNLKF